MPLDHDIDSVIHFFEQTVHDRYTQYAVLSPSGVLITLLEQPVCDDGNGDRNDELLNDVLQNQGAILAHLLLATSNQ